MVWTCGYSATLCDSVGPIDVDRYDNDYNDGNDEDEDGDDNGEDRSTKEQQKGSIFLNWSFFEIIHKQLQLFTFLNTGLHNQLVADIKVDQSKDNSLSKQGLIGIYRKLHISN